jgi:glyoxylase-like metal-dependent hydrolase (beta-lactamase superfamily II)
MGWPVYVHREDAENLRVPGSDGIPNTYGIEGAEPDGMLADGDEKVLGLLRFKVVHTPGHSPGCVLFYFEKEKVLISGDTLFRGTYGRVDLPSSNPQKMKESLAKIKQFPDDVTVYPGHGGSTTIGREQRWL